MDKRDQIVNHCFRLFHLWAGGGPRTERFSIELNGLWERLRELDPKDYHENFADGVERGCDEWGNLNPEGKPPSAPTTPDS